LHIDPAPGAVRLTRRNPVHEFFVAHSLLHTINPAIAQGFFHGFVVRGSSFSGVFLVETHEQFRGRCVVFREPFPEFFS